MKLRLPCLLLAAALLGACATTPAPATQALLDDARQLVLVVTPDWDSNHGALRRYERSGDGWRQVGSEVPVTVGRSGSAWGLGLDTAPPPTGPVKREGDGRSPAGIFAIGTAFGYPAHVDTGLAYEAMGVGDWCVDVPGSPLYNRIVDVRDVGAEAVKASSEPMRRDLHAGGDQRYRIGFVIEHNAAGSDRAGSCIFAHVWKSPSDATAGCTAMSDADMQTLLRWLDRRRNPRFVLLPKAEFARLRTDWELPGN